MDFFSSIGWLFAFICLIRANLVEERLNNRSVTTQQPYMKREGQMKKDIILHFKDGHKQEVSLAHPFFCEENELKVIMDESGKQLIFHLGELSGILFLNGTCPVDVAHLMIIWKKW